MSYPEIGEAFCRMLLPYDPFGKDRIVYTIQNHFREEPDIEFDDGAATYFFFTKGKKGDVSEEAKKLLR